eukprot:m.198579 g.198579  ORF g.198579 m.198579 type:complete len:274 (-) comp15717_c0_seq20:1484-2305(-)
MADRLMEAEEPRGSKLLQIFSEKQVTAMLTSPLQTFSEARVQQAQYILAKSCCDGGLDEGEGESETLQSWFTEEHRKCRQCFLRGDQAACTTFPALSCIYTSLLQQPQYFSQNMNIIFENSDLWVVDKAFDTQISHGKKQVPRFHLETTVEAWLRNETKQKQEKLESNWLFKRCHNLDFATSGMLVMAKTQVGLKAASIAFDKTDGRAGTVEKEYSALVIGWYLLPNCPVWINYTYSGQPGTQESSMPKFMLTLNHSSKCALWMEARLRMNQT